MITPSLSLTATERVRPRLALDFTNPSLDSRITLTRTGATATRVNASGVIETVSADTPRFDYDSISLACRGLLIEETRTNALDQSNSFNNASWLKTGMTFGANATTSPDGTSNATKLIPDTSSTSLHRIYVLPSGAYAFSVYAKAGEYYGLRLFADGFDVVFNLANGTVASGAGTIEAIKNGWYRCTAVATITSAQICVYPTTSVVTYSGDNSSGLYVYGAQLEAGSFATSYIPTAGSAVTRNADVAVMAGTNFSSWWQANRGGVLVCAKQRSVSGTRPLVQFDDGTANEIIALRGNTTNPELYIVDGGTPQAQIDAGTIAANTSYRLAGAWGADACAASINSGTPVLDGAATIPTITQMRLGSDGTNYLNGHLESIEYYDTPPTSAGLQVLSSAAGYRSMIRSMINPVL